MSVTKESFGQIADGKDVDLYTLTNVNGLIAKITNYGGIVTSLVVPDRDGNLADVVLGHESVESYIKDNSPYFGALIGRYGNRIRDGKFALNGNKYQLATNNDVNHLHGGDIGFDKVVWDAEMLEGDTAVKLTYLCADMEEGYPGNLTVTVVIALTDDNELKITYGAETDKDTIVNLTHHGYFNLAGCCSGDILSHELMISADKYTPVSDALIPTGELADVGGTLMDFRAPMAIGARIADVEGGYDHNYVLNGPSGSVAARVVEKGSGRVMEVSTTEPGMQFYTGNFLDGSVTGKGATYNKHNGFCLEAQHYPDSPNIESFPSAVLKVGERYSQVTSYKFSVE